MKNTRYILGQTGKSRTYQVRVYTWYLVCLVCSAEVAAEDETCFSRLPVQQSICCLKYFRIAPTFRGQTIHTITINRSLGWLYGVEAFLVGTK